MKIFITAINQHLTFGIQGPHQYRNAGFLESFVGQRESFHLRLLRLLCCRQFLMEKQRKKCQCKLLFFNSQQGICL
jgi:hypothetical protein